MTASTLKHNHRLLPNPVILGSGMPRHVTGARLVELVKNNWAMLISSRLVSPSLGNSFRTVPPYCTLDSRHLEAESELWQQSLLHPRSSRAICPNACRRDDSQGAFALADGLKLTIYAQASYQHYVGSTLKHFFFAFKHCFSLWFEKPRP